MSVICVFGDSITWGAWDIEQGGWVNRLRFYYDNQSDFEKEVYNLGVDGDYVRDVLKRFDVEAQARNPDIIILAIGINDSSHPSNPRGTDLGKFEVQFKELLEKACKFTNKITVLGLTNVDEKSKEHGYTNSNIVLYNDKIKSIAKNKKLPFVNLFNTLAKNELEDGLHPNAKGHQKIFEKVKKVLKI